MCTDADCNFVISGDASKGGFHIWPMLHVGLFKRTTNELKTKTCVRLANSWLFIIYKTFRENRLESKWNTAFRVV